MNPTSNSCLSALDTELISHLDNLVFSNQGLHDQIVEVYEAAKVELYNAKNSLTYACQEVNIDAFKQRLPERLHCHVNLCRVFLLKRGQKLPKLEIHRNSTQRLVSFRNNGSMHIAQSDSNDGKFLKFDLTSPGETVDSNYSRRWNIVPSNIWHYPEASSDGDWCTVTFHSASSSDIIDEHRDR